MLQKVAAALLCCCSTLANAGQIAEANGIHIWYDTFGKKSDPAVLLIMGACSQGVLWPKTFCEKVANAGFFVIRYDHRDLGLSTCFDFDKEPYGIMDMALDAAGLLDALKIDKAHLFGVSLGGLLAETLAAYFPEKIHSILIMGSTCDIRPMNIAYMGKSPEENAILPPPSAEYLAWMQEFMKLNPQTEEDKLAQRIEGWERLNGQKLPLDAEINRAVHSEFLSRLRYPPGIVNHIHMLSSEDSEAFVRTIPSKIAVPTTILHGTEDPIFPSAHGAALKELIPNADYRLVEGMGHVPNEHFYDLYIDILKQQAACLVVKAT